MSTKGPGPGSNKISSNPSERVSSAPIPIPIPIPIPQDHKSLSGKFDDDIFSNYKEYLLFRQKDKNTSNPILASIETDKSKEEKFVVGGPKGVKKGTKFGF